MKLGFFCLPAGAVTFSDAVAETQKFGLKHLEISAGLAELTPTLDEAVLLENARKARALLDETGITPTCFSCGCDIIGEKSANSQEMLRKSAKACQILGIPYLHHTVYREINPAKGYPAFSDVLDDIVTGVRESYDYAEQLGIKCVFENQGFVLNGCERFEIFLDKVDRDVGVVADLGNIYFFNELPEAFVGRMLPRIVHVHLKDYIKKSGNGLNPGKYWNKTINGDYLRDTLIGHGIVEFERIFKMLIASGYDGAFSLENSGLEWARYESTAISVDNAKRFYENAKSNLNL